ncbi:Smg6 [Drosophila busckii]|uniref:Smg6 n=1 Tax=Drosophila busckii TaxID=30019 RepID=A0A0M4F430_DROBS|nr:telomerase-binding protein EST1A [Drosophila busckii]ALC46450.1 Smg6 [Drosophila busckii]
MSRKGATEPNDISLIIGTLPKRLQNKFAASCSQHSHAAEDAENAEPATAPAPATTRPVTILSKPKCNNAGSTLAPVLDTSGCSGSGNGSLERTPGILRVSVAASAATASKATRRRERDRNHSTRLQQQMPLSPLSRVRLTTEHPVWFEHLLTMPNARIIVQLYDQLMVLQQRNLIVTNWKSFCSLHKQLQEAFSCLVLEQLKFVSEHKVDAFFWKLLFYNTREHLKRQRAELANNHLLPLIENSLKFYRTLYDKLITKYMSRCEGALKIVAQRLLICLGDLSRYRANQLQVTDFAEACKYYQRAQELLPNNGAPYNQLAIVAIYNHKRFDAVYYYMRSLLTSNAIQSAKECLLDLFDEIRRKYEETEMKQSPLHCAAGKSNKSKQMRREVWIYPDGIRRLHRTDVKGNKLKSKTVTAEVNRYDQMPAEELMPRIMSLYLYLVGKLFTGTDMECMYQLLGKLQIQLGAALKHENLWTRNKILKIVALNIFVLEHNKAKDNRRETRYHSFNFANTLFGLMLSKANELLAYYADNSIELLRDSNCTRINTYLQFVKIYIQWLTKNVDLWEPVRTEEHTIIDCWAELLTLFEYAERITETFAAQIEQPAKIILDEDIVLSGFEPLGRQSIGRRPSHQYSECEQFIERMRKISQFQEFYLNNEDSLQLPLDSSFSVEDINAAMQVALNVFESENCAAPVQSNAVTSKVEHDFDNVDADVTELCRLKKELEAKAKAQQMCNSKLEEILKLVDTKLYIEVRPRYLLPDTNCFIDCLEDIEKLSMEFTRFTLIIPLTVVKELDGLSKGVKLDSYRSSKQTQRIHHFDEVSSRAKKSLEFIKTAKANVRCATTKGSFINASLFSLVEEEYASNDDKILATAVAVSKTVSSEQCRDGKCFIRTELVLITTDRNLRVKALPRNLAVSALDEFLQWAKESTSNE